MQCRIRSGKASNLRRRSLRDQRLKKWLQRKNIDVKLQHNLKEIRPEAKEAVFEVLDFRRRSHDQIRHAARDSKDGAARLH